jgi:phosphoglycolate phosphatase-like HAD superfamily hydrolase
VVVELIGPVVDDMGAVGRTISEALTSGGLELLPGALDQAAGMAPAHALRTLAEGHGRFELVEELDLLLARSLPTLIAWAGGGNAMVVPGAVDAWQALARPEVDRAMLTSLPAAAAHELARRHGVAVSADEWICADDLRGPPHPDHILRHAGALGHPVEKVALVQSIGAALAAAAAGCRVVAVGNRGGAAMFADEQLSGIAEFK